MEEGQTAPSLSSSTSEIYKSALESIVIRAQGGTGIQSSSELFRSRANIQSKANGVDNLKIRGAIEGKDLSRIPMIAGSRPVLGVSLTSDLVSGTTGVPPCTAPSPSSATSSPVTLKPPRIMPILAASSQADNSTSTDSPRTQPVAAASPSSFSPCYLVDVEVQLKPGCADILLKDRVGVVRKVEGKTAMVHIKENPSYITIPHEALVPVKPKVSDSVKVIGGNSSLVGLIGTLNSFTPGVDGEQGVVQFLSWSNQRPRNPAQISLAHLGRYSPLSKFGSNSSHSSPNSNPRNTLPGELPAKTSSIVAPRLVTVPNYGVLPVSTSRVGNGTSSSLNGLPLSFRTPPSSKQPPAPSKQTPPAHISNLPSNLSSRPAVVMSDPVRTSESTLSSSGALYERRNGHQGLNLNPFAGKGAVNGHSRLMQYGDPRIRLNPSSLLGVVVDKDCLRTNKDQSASILLSKIAAMNKFMPISRGGGAHELEMSEVLEKLVKQQRDYLYELTAPLTPGGDVKASHVRVSLICPLGQQRMKYPSRGRSCKHLQCFDAENYINFHKKLILRNRLKQQKGPINKPVPLDKTWNCPICEKVAHLQHLYIDKALMKLVQETDATEVELKDDGTWAPVAKNAGNDVIDLTGDD